MTPRFEAAFIQCLKEGVYPGPANLNQRFRADHKRFNRLNGQYTKMRLALMYLFGVPYVRGHLLYIAEPYDRPRGNNAGTIPEWPYFMASVFNHETKGWEYETPPVQGSRKHEIQDPDKPWELKHK